MARRGPPRGGGGWDVHAVDLRGHGDSPRWDDALLRGTPDVLLADAVAVCESLSAPAVVVGHSMGGLTGLRLGVTRPDLVRALVLEDPAQPTGSWRPDPGFVAASVEHVETVTHDPAGERARMQRESAWSDAEIDGWVAAKPRVDRRFLREGLFLGSGEWEPLFNRLRVPTLVVGPVGGAMLPRRELLSNPAVELVEIPGCGHQVRRDNPEGYHAVVDPFLARHRGPRLELTSVTLGASDVAGLAAFYARLLGTRVHDADEGWAQLRADGAQGSVTVNVEREREHVAPVWPSRPGAPLTQAHLDIAVDDLAAATDWAVACGARLAEEQPQDDLRVLLDPAGHPFCLFLRAPRSGG